MLEPAGGEFGIYGFVKALDLKTGEIVWTAHNIGPDADMLVKADTFKPHYDKGTELGMSSWPRDGWKTGGAPVWGWMSYDPDLDLLYYGTGNPSPYNAEQRPGDNKWTSSVLARRPSDGALVWAYQFTPHDNWDYDAVATMILADVKIAGQARKALVTFNKNGFQYTLDRATGEVLAASPFVQVTWATKIDLATGRPVLDPTRQTGASKGNIKNVCPSLEGGVSPASPGAYSPHTGLFYTSTNNMCMDFAAARVTHIKGTPIHRCRFAVPGWSRREPRILHGVGRLERQEGVGDEGALPRVERSSGHRGRCRVLRNTRWVVQVGRCEDG